MNPIEARHHLKSDQFLPYREGVTINRPSKSNEGSWADIGLQKHCKVDYLLQPNTRVTLKLSETCLETESKHFSGQIVA
jgi:methyltransferase